MNLFGLYFWGRHESLPLDTHADRRDAARVRQNSGALGEDDLFRGQHDGDRGANQPGGVLADGARVQAGQRCEKCQRPRKRVTLSSLYFSIFNFRWLQSPLRGWWVRDEKNDGGSERVSLPVYYRVQYDFGGDYLYHVDHCGSTSEVASSTAPRGASPWSKSSCRHMFSFDRSIDWLIDWPICWFTFQLTDWLADMLIDCLIDCTWICRQVTLWTATKRLRDCSSELLSSFWPLSPSYSTLFSWKNQPSPIWLWRKRKSPRLSFTALAWPQLPIVSYKSRGIWKDHGTTILVRCWMKHCWNFPWCVSLDVGRPWIHSIIENQSINQSINPSINHQSNEQSCQSINQLFDFSHRHANVFACHFSVKSSVQQAQIPMIFCRWVSTDIPWSVYWADSRRTPWPGFCPWWRPVFVCCKVPLKPSSFSTPANGSSTGRRQKTRNQRHPFTLTNQHGKPSHYCWLSISPCGLLTWVPHYVVNQSIDRKHW